MELPHVYPQEKPAEEVFLLKKSLYGLHQSGERVVYFDKFLKSYKLTRSREDPYVHFDKERKLIVGVYVDDLLVMSNLETTIQKFKDSHCFIGKNVKITNTISHHFKFLYALKMLKRSGQPFGRKWSSNFRHSLHTSKLSPLLKRE
ncbi:hypothetical protein AVEN_256848-1 [Araneus ventricosus]|uniref:Reverse transcriptase Ty1/copia-type domain-containing protein n=1 Tax=Araneus ventricosus TaxID=182803 RepID=A0A4Y2QC56_ARAVE|nr:hypothetical protein AVEN_256848-1 [Araneus ventricosus]